MPELAGTGPEQMAGWAGWKKFEKVAPEKKL